MRVIGFSIRIPGLKIIHFISGKRVGESRPACFKGLAHYDSYGRVTGKSIRNFIGELNHYNCKDRCTGYSRKNAFATTTHFNCRGFVDGITYSMFGILLIHADPVCYNGEKGGR
jgi:hypothetical protein